MAMIESVKRDISSLGGTDNEAIMNYLEEVITFDSLSKEITNTIKEYRFSKKRVCPYFSHEKVSRLGKYKTSKDIFVSYAIKLLLIYPCALSVIVGIILISCYYMRSPRLMKSQ